MAPSRMVSVSASVNLPLHHKVQKFSSGTGSPGWYRKKGRKTVVVVRSNQLLCHQKRIHRISIYKGIQNSAISSMAANRIVARLYT